MSFLSPSDDVNAIGSVTGWGGNSSSSTSDTHSWTWNSSQIENMMNNFDSDIYYENKTIDPMNTTLRNALNYAESGNAINTANNVIGWGKKGFGSMINRLQKEAAVTPEQYWAALEGGAQHIYQGMSGYMSQQNQAIEDQAYSEAGQNLAQNTTSNMASGGAYTSGAAMEHNSIAASTGNSIASQEAALSTDVMNEALGISSNIARGYTKGYNSLTSEGLNIAGNAMSAGANMKGKATKNMWNAGLVDQLASQLNTNNNRRNRMINGNLPLAEEMFWLSAELSTAGVDTNTHTETKTSGGSGGWF